MQGKPGRVAEVPIGGEMDFEQDVVTLARALLGARLVVRGSGGTILETEAYGRDDPASHSFRGPTLRNAAMFGPPGTVYVYLSYGVHLCLNVVGRPGEAVLLRALWPEIGVEEMARRRGLPPDSPSLASGPGRLGQALGLDLRDSGKSFGADGFTIQPTVVPFPVLEGPRIGISRATDLPWRFGLAGAAGLSRPFPARGHAALSASR